MNILVLSAGTRCQLIHYFKEKGNGFEKVIAVDCSIYAPALYMADCHYIIPSIRESDYLQIVFDICRRENISVVLPLQEDELELISMQKKAFAKMGILAVVSEPEAVKICRDKLLMYQVLVQHGIQGVETYDYGTQKEEIQGLSLPVFVKERRGAGSTGMLKVNHWPLLSAYAENTEKTLIVQPYLKSKEYGVDVYVDFISGEVVSIFAKEKLRMRAGETEKSKSYKDERLFALIEKTVKIFGLKGPVDIDVLQYEGEYHVLEINPRFGGGYPHAYACGVNFMKCISQNAAGIGNPSTVGNYEAEKVLLKYTESILKNESDMF